MQKMALWEMIQELIVTKFTSDSECMDILRKANENNKNNKAIRNPNDRIQVLISQLPCVEKLPNHWKGVPND